MQKTVLVSGYSPETRNSMRAEANIWKFTKQTLQWKCVILSMCLNLCWMKARYLSSLTASLACNQEKSPCNQRWTEGPAISEHTYAAALGTQGYLTAFNAVFAQSGSVKSEFLLLKKITDKNKFSTCFAWQFTQTLPCSIDYTAGEYHLVFS